MRFLPRGHWGRKRIPQGGMRVRALPRSLSAFIPACFGLALPRQRHGVGAKLAVIRQQRHALDSRLGKDQPVERVTVMKWQREQGGAICERIVSAGGAGSGSAASDLPLAKIV